MGWALCSAAQPSDIRRTDLQRHDLSVAGREVVQVRVDFGPGAAFGRRTHPGEEIAYVIEGSLEYQVEGQPSVTLTAGDTLFIPARAIHAARNVGTGNGAELATYIVEKGEAARRYAQVVLPRSRRIPVAHHDDCWLLRRSGPRASLRTVSISKGGVVGHLRGKCAFVVLGAFLRRCQQPVAKVVPDTLPNHHPLVSVT